MWYTYLTCDEKRSCHVHGEIRRVDSTDPGRLEILPPASLPLVFQLSRDSDTICFHTGFYHLKLPTIIMPKPHIHRKITMELLPEEKPDSLSPQEVVKPESKDKDGAEHGNESEQCPPAPSINFDFSTLLSGINSKIFDNLGSLALPARPTALELATAKTLRECFGSLPPIDGPLYSSKSLNQVQQDLLGASKDQQLADDIKRFIMIECSKDKASMEVICDQSGHPIIAELPSAVANITFPTPNSADDKELRYVPLKGCGVAMGAPLNGLIPSFDSADKSNDASTEVKGTKACGKPTSRQGGQGTTAEASRALSLHNIQRFKDGLTVDDETSNIIKETLKVKTNAGRKRGRTGNVPDDWDEPSDEEILANLLRINPNMKMWETAEIKKELRKIRNRFSAELSRMRKKTQQAC